MESIVLAVSWGQGGLRTLSGSPQAEHCLFPPQAEQIKRHTNSKGPDFANFWDFWILVIF